MPAKIEVTGLDEMLKKVEETGKHAQGIAAKALYVGAGIVADGITKAAGGIQTETNPPRDRKRLPTPKEKADLLAAGAAGIARFDKNGIEVNTVVGYANKGYTASGKPVPVIANAINSGTSFMQKQPFIRQGINATAAAAKSAIDAEISRMVDEALKDL